MENITMDILRKTYFKEKVSIIGIKTNILLANLLKVKSIMGIFMVQLGIKGHLRIVKGMAQEHVGTLMEKHIKDNGWKEGEKVKEYLLI